MKVSALVFTPLAVAAFISPNNQNNKKIFGAPSSNNKNFVDMVSNNREGVKLSYSNDENNGGNKSDDGYMDEFNKEKEFIRRSEKYAPQEMYRAFVVRDWAKLQRNLKGGANPDMELQRGNALAHLIADIPLASLLTSTYNNSLDTMKQISKSGYNFGIKDNKGRTALEVAKDRGNEQLAQEIKKLEVNQKSVPTNITEINDGLLTIARQVNPTEIGRKMATNYLKAGADVDVVIGSQDNLNSSGKMPTNQYLDSLGFNSKNNGTSIIDEVKKNWDEKSIEAFTNLTKMAKDNAIASSDKGILKELGVVDRDIENKMVTMIPKWQSAVESFVDSAGSNREDSKRKQNRGIV
jgi:hypothetical protein